MWGEYSWWLRGSTVSCVETLQTCTCDSSVNSSKYGPQLTRDSIPWFKGSFSGRFFFLTPGTPCGEGGTHPSRIRIRIQTCSKSMICIRIRTREWIWVRTFDPVLKKWRRPLKRRDDVSRILCEHNIYWISSRFKKETRFLVRLFTDFIVGNCFSFPHSNLAHND